VIEPIIIPGFPVSNVSVVDVKWVKIENPGCEIPERIAIGKILSMKLKAIKAQKIDSFTLIITKRTIETRPDDTFWVSFENYELLEKVIEEKTKNAERTKKSTNKSKSNTKKRKKVKRNMMKRENLPLVSPFLELNSEKGLEKIKLHLENDSAVLLTWFKESPGTSLKGGSISGIIDLLIEKAKEIFIDCEITTLDWPRVDRIIETKRATHPLISNICKVSVIIQKKGKTVYQEEDFQDAVTYAAYEYLIGNRSKNKWTIIGDETGQFEEPRGGRGNDGRTSTMCWVGIPPNVNLPILPLDFHSTEDLSHLNMGLKELIKHKDLLFFTFSYESGTVAEGQTTIGKDPHLMFWQDTLPLVLEYIVNHSKEKLEIDIFVEQVKIFQSGIGILQPMVQDLKSVLNSRESWSKTSFDQLWIISKNPCEHPWMGYPDAIGHLFGKRKSDLLTKLDNLVLKSPYRQDSLNGPINSLLKNSANPLKFIKTLGDVSIEDVRDYVIPFFENSLISALKKLSSGDWQDLLNHTESISKTKQGQNANSLIDKYVDLDKTLLIFGNQSDRFNFLMAILGSSNHNGMIGQANKCKKHILSLIDEGYKPTDDRMKKFKNLCGGLNNNLFDFSLIEDFSLPSQISHEEDINSLGAQAQIRALRNLESDWEQAWEIEEYLLERTSNERDKIRRMVLRSELLMDKARFAEAEELLESTIFKQNSISKEELRKDSYYLAALIKSLSLGNPKSEEIIDLSKIVKSVLNEYHPSQRVAYWSIRWMINMGEQDSDLFRDCMEHLRLLSSLPYFRHNVPGVILSCELLDLNSRGCKFNFDVPEFHNTVLKNSQPETQKWVKDHPPIQGDWMAPLNFNYY
jgi:hypothetical protein